MFFTNEIQKFNLNDGFLKNLFSIAKQSNKMVYEVTDMFGDCLTIEEIEYWMVYNVITNAEVNNVDIKGLSFEAAVEEIEYKVKERQAKWARKSK